jgi:hypothetical protein
MMGIFLLYQVQNPPTILGIRPRSCMRRIRTVSELVSTPDHPRLSIDTQIASIVAFQTVLYCFLVLHHPVSRIRHIRRPSSLETAKSPTSTAYGCEIGFDETISSQIS